MFEARAARQAYEAAGLAGGKRVLEVAVGGGEFFCALAKTAGLKRCVGVDLSAPMLSRARRRLAAVGVERPNLCRANALSLPFGNSAFDILFNLYMIDLLMEGDFPCVFKEFARVLRPGGRLIVLSMARQARALNAIWMQLYRCSPLMTGGCRPVPVEEILASNGWNVGLREVISQCGFRSELFVARFAGGAG